MENWQLVLPGKFLTIGIHCDETEVLAVNYLPAKRRALPPQNLLAAECERQLRAYFNAPHRHRFDLPLAAAKTPHQRRVREIVQSIAGGETMTYGDIAKRLKNSSPRAVGGACRANDMPLIVPCHRVVGATGLGGFMGDGGESKVAIKAQLLRYEGVC